VVARHKSGLQRFGLFVSVPKEFASHLAVSFEPFPIGATFKLSNGAVSLVVLILEQGTATVTPYGAG
jgi:hypothetical protein